MATWISPRFRTPLMEFLNEEWDGQPNAGHPISIVDLFIAEIGVASTTAGLTPVQIQEKIDYYSNFLTTKFNSLDIVEAVMDDPGGGFLRLVLNTSIPYGDLRNCVLSGASNITQCNQSVGTKDNHMQAERRCIWCGGLIDDFAECEHVFPVVLALLFLGFTGGPNEFKNLIEILLEYGWAHQLCNQIKSNKVFIKLVDIGGVRKVSLDLDVLRQFYVDVHTTASYNPMRGQLRNTIIGYCHNLITDIDGILPNEANLDNICACVNVPNNVPQQIEVLGSVGCQQQASPLFPDNLFLQIGGNVNFKEPTDTLITNIVTGQIPGDPLNGQQPDPLCKGDPATIAAFPKVVDTTPPDNVAVGVENLKSHPFITLINICRYLNYKKQNLINPNPGFASDIEQLRAFFRFVIPVRASDFTTLLTNSVDTGKLIALENTLQGYLVNFNNLRLKLESNVEDKIRSSVDREFSSYSGAKPPTRVGRIFKKSKYDMYQDFQTPGKPKDLLTAIYNSAIKSKLKKFFATRAKLCSAMMKIISQIRRIDSTRGIALETQASPYISDLAVKAYETQLRNSTLFMTTDALSRKIKVELNLNITPVQFVLTGGSQKGTSQKGRSQKGRSQKGRGQKGRGQSGEGEGEVAMSFEQLDRKTQELVDRFKDEEHLEFEAAQKILEAEEEALLEATELLETIRYVNYKCII